MKKIFSIIALSLFVGIFAFSPAFAVEEVKTDSSTQESVVISTLNIQNVKIVSQEANIIRVSFDINNREIVQTGVKYGVKLTKEVEGKKYIVDEKVYDEILSISENTRTHKEISYEAPKYLSGDYTLALVGQNVNGFSFSTNSLKKITLTSTEKGVILLPETCSFAISGDKTVKKYSIDKVAKVAPTESLIVSCKVKNTTGSTETLTPSLETHLFFMYGEKVETPSENMNPIVLKPNEEKLVSITLPQISNPQKYATTLSFKNERISSNTISVSYVVSGLSVTIKNISLDKDFYKKGEVAKASLIWAPSSASDFTTATASISLLNGNGSKCADPYTSVLTKGDYLINIPFTISKSSCRNPIIKATISDTNGNILDQKEFKFTTTNEVASKAYMTYGLILLGASIIIALLFIIKKWKTKKNKIPGMPISIILPFFSIILLGSLMSPNVARADLVYFYDQWLVADLSLDKDWYIAGDTMVASGTISHVTDEIADDPEYTPQDVSLGVTVNGTTKGIDSQSYLEYGDMFGGNAYFTVPYDGGFNVAYFFMSATSPDGEYYSSGKNISYITVYRPTISLSASKSLVNAGESFSLTWSSTNAEECFFQGGMMISNGDLSGSVSTSITAPTTYYLTCASGFGNIYYSDNASTSVNVDVVTLPAPTASIDVVKKVLIKGVETTTLFWDSDNTTNCEVIGTNGYRSTLKSSNIKVGPFDDDTTFTIECDNNTETPSVPVTSTLRDPVPSVGSPCIGIWCGSGGDYLQTQQLE